MVKLTQKLASKKFYSQVFYLGKFPYNLINSGNLEKYYRILADFNFISDKINHSEFGVQALIKDYDLIDELEVQNYTEYNYSKVKTLKLIQGALRLSAHILNQDKTQLAGQLLIRLQYFQISEIQGILKQAKESKAEPWLRPLSSSLNPPGARLLRTLTGHNGAVLAVTVTPDGKYLISASKDNTIKAWDLQTGEEFFTLNGHSDWVSTLVVTSDSKRVISGSKDKTIKIWSLETEKELFPPLEGHTRTVNALVVTSDGKQLISASDDSTFRVWDLENKKEVFNSYNYGDYITALTITPDNERIIFAISNTEIIVWSLVSKKKLITFKGHSDIVSTLAVTSDGKYLISGSWDKTLKVWNLETRIFLLKRLLFTLKGHSDRITAVVITPDNKLIISDSLDKTHKVWNLPTQKELFSLKENFDEINPLTVTPDGKWLISGSEDKTIKIWSLEENVEEEFTPLGHTRKVNALAITPNNKKLISSSEDDTLKVWSLETGKELFTFNEDDSWLKTQEKFLTIEDVDDLILSLDALDELPAFKGNLEKLFTVDGFSKLINYWQKSTFKVWNLQTGKIDFMNYRNRVIAIVINPIYRCLIYKSWQYDSSKHPYPEFILKVWNLSTNKNFKLNNYDGGENPAVITPDGNRLISRSKQNFLTIWDLDTGEIVSTFSGRISSIKTLVITQDSQLIIAGLADKTIKVWNLKNKENIFTFTGHIDFVTTLAVTPDNKKLISGSLDKTIKIWDLEQGKEMITIQDKNYASKITITLDGKWIFSESICDDFSLFKVWDISTGEEVFSLTRYDKNNLKVYKSSNGRIIANFSIEDELKCCALAPDGVTIVAGDELGVVHFFRLEKFPYNIQQTLKEKSANFVGREFVFTAINNFLNRYDRGYFTIVGAPGSGKSYILIKYVTENPDVFYYNSQVKGKNRAEEFLKAISNQIEATNETSLQIILQQISDSLKSNQRFIIVIDSLEAIDYNSQAIGSNLFYLPRYLPKGIYFLLARRPFLREKSGLLIEAPFQYLNLQDYPEENFQDIQTYIEKYLKEFLPSPSAIKETFGVNQEEFIRQLINRSETNFMYVNQILTAIQTGFYHDKFLLTDILDTTILDAKSLPYALEAYYRKHLEKMFPEEQGEEYNSNPQAVLNILVRNSSPISVEEISQIIDVDEYDVQEILEDWIEFLTVHRINGEICYNLYYQSFRNWLIKVKT